MRHLLQPRVLKLASIAAFVSALACYPRLALWNNHPAPIWYLEATIFVCGLVLWGFVFAWHLPYFNRPAFALQLHPGLFAITTFLGVCASAASYLWFDPIMRTKFPEEFPADMQHWLAAVPFTLSFNQLFLIFAPFDWLMRLFKNRWAAMLLTPLLGVAVLAMKMHSLSEPISPLLAVGLLAGRAFLGLLSSVFYLRGGIILVWWWTILLQARHLLHLI